MKVTKDQPDQIEGQIEFDERELLEEVSVRAIEDENAEYDKTVTTKPELLQLEFFIPLKKIPSVTAQQHRAIGQGKGKKVLFIDTPEIANARQLYMSHLAIHRPIVPATGPISLKVYWCYQETKKHPAGTWKTSRPDTDNLQKLFKDCMTRVGFWKDDAQVVEETIGKGYERYEGIYVKIEEHATEFRYD